jgi:SAM-dependent methyltransferase
MTASGDQRGWADYWKADCAASCEPENPATALEIARLWQDWLADFPDGSRILDVATGNGIVLAHAASAARARGRRFALTGVDLADIDPPRYVRNLDPELRAATFRGGVAAESLPFADGSFDLVVSQYGIEYADLERALAEVARVLVPGGALVWLAHAADSEIARQHRAQAAELDFLLAAGGPVAAMHGIVAMLRARPAPDEIAAALTACRTAAADFSRAHPPAAIVREVLDGFAALVSRTSPTGADTLAAALTEAGRRLAAHRDRIGSLLDAVLTPERFTRVRALLAAPAWTSVEVTNVSVGAARSFIGSRIRASRTGAS